MTLNQHLGHVSDLEGAQRHVYAWDHKIEGPVAADVHERYLEWTDGKTLAHPLMDILVWFFVSDAHEQFDEFDIEELKSFRQVLKEEMREPDPHEEAEDMLADMTEEEAEELVEEYGKEDE